MAGPTIRAALNEVEFSATAFDRSFSSTRSETKVWRAGESKAVTQPSRNANTYTCQSWTSPVTTRIPSPRARAPMEAWVANRSFLRSSRSAARPVRGKRRSWGPNWSAMTTPMAVAFLWVSWVNTSQSCPMRCIHVPTLDTMAPLAHIR